MSITLTTPFIVAIGGVQVEDDTVGACTSVVTDFLARTQTTTFQVGTLTGNPPNLNAGPQGLLQNQSYILVVHLDTGAWSDNHGHSGTIPANILTPSWPKPCLTEILLKDSWQCPEVLCRVQSYLGLRFNPFSVQGDFMYSAAARVVYTVTQADIDLGILAAPVLWQKGQMYGGVQNSVIVWNIQDTTGQPALTLNFVQLDMHDLNGIGI